MHAAQIAASARLRRVHALLSDGRERTTLEIMAFAGVCAVNSCIAELRANGAAIACRQAHDGVARRWLYRMERPVPGWETAGRHVPGR